MRQNDTTSRPTYLPTNQPSCTFAEGCMPSYCCRPPAPLDHHPSCVMDWVPLRWQHTGRRHGSNDGQKEICQASSTAIDYWYSRWYSRCTSTTAHSSLPLHTPLSLQRRSLAPGLSVARQLVEDVGLEQGGVEAHKVGYAYQQLQRYQTYDNLLQVCRVEPLEVLGERPQKVKRPVQPCVEEVESLLDVVVPLELLKEARLPLIVPHNVGHIRQPLLDVELVSQVVQVDQRVEHPLTQRTHSPRPDELLHPIGRPLLKRQDSFDLVFEGTEAGGRHHGKRHRQLVAGSSAVVCAEVDDIVLYVAVALCVGDIHCLGLPRGPQLVQSRGNRHSHEWCGGGGHTAVLVVLGHAPKHHTTALEEDCSACLLREARAGLSHQEMLQLSKDEVSPEGIVAVPPPLLADARRHPAQINGARQTVCSHMRVGRHEVGVHVRLELHDSRLRPGLHHIQRGAWRRPHRHAHLALPCCRRCRHDCRRRDLDFAALALRQSKCREASPSEDPCWMK
mmetsp:Transcript_20903/g.59623  ORF Transcript_20903/g.59623 Transcript_20903/m.59623 type:complete len:505 (+) Transcript_20903:104-1618(+)